MLRRDGEDESRREGRSGRLVSECRLVAFPRISSNPSSTSDIVQKRLCPLPACSAMKQNKDSTRKYARNEPEPQPGGRATSCLSSLSSSSSHPPLAPSLASLIEMLTFLSRTRTTRLLVSSSVRLPFSLVVSPREAPILTFVVPPPFPSFLSSRLQSLLRLSSTQINPSSTPNVVNQNLAQTNGAAAEGGELTREQIYPHTRPAPRLAPVVHLGAAPIPGGGRWSGVQTGAGGMLLPPPGTPEGKPGVIGPGVYKGSEWNLLKWEITERGLHWKVPGLMA